MLNDLHEFSKSTGVFQENSAIITSTSARGTRKENLEYLASMLSSRGDGRLKQSSSLLLDGSDDDQKSRTRSIRFGGVPSAYAPKTVAAPKQHTLGFRKYAPLYDVAVWSDFTVTFAIAPGQFCAPSTPAHIPTITPSTDSHCAPSRARRSSPARGSRRWAA